MVTPGLTAGPGRQAISDAVMIAISFAHAESYHSN
jgi:hypothetical protein